MRKAMRERPIIFDAESVRAILAGRKTQTRRVVKRDVITAAGILGIMGGTGPAFDLSRCPSGAAGDRLWARETFCLESSVDGVGVDDQPPPFDDGRPIRWHEDDDSGRWWQQPHYRATDPTPELVYDDRDEPSVKWSSPIHMPRWASRFTLEVVAVRVEWLQEISEADAIAEGAPDTRPVWEDVPGERGGPREWYRNGWDRLNTKRGYPWESNPFVWSWSSGGEDVRTNLIKVNVSLRFSEEERQAITHYADYRDDPTTQPRDCPVASTVAIEEWVESVVRDALARLTR